MCTCLTLAQVPVPLRLLVGALSPLASAQHSSKAPPPLHDLPHSARKLTDEQRASIANYFAVYKGHENDRAKLALGGAAVMHPAVQQAVASLMPNWEQVGWEGGGLEGQATHTWGMAGWARGHRT